MDNQINVGDQNTQQIEREKFNQNGNFLDKKKVNYWKISTLLFAALFLGAVGLMVKNSEKIKEASLPYLTPSLDVNTFPKPTDLNSTSPIPPNNTTSTTGNIWQTYTNRAVQTSIYTISIPIGQNGWTLKHTTSLDPYYTKDQNINDEMVIEKTPMKIKIYRPEASGPGACLYSDSPEFNGPGQKFSDYTELQLGSRVARRAKVDTKIVEGKDTYTICQKEKNSDFFVSITEFGYISYEVPVGSKVEDMDSIIKSMRKI